MEKETLETFVSGMINVSKAIHRFDPNVIIAPMNGAVALVDILNIVDPNFDISQVEYMPASSKLTGVRQAITNWTRNFLAENCPTEGGYRMAVIDEVVSGNSSVRVYKSITEGINQFARERVQQLGISPKTIKRRIDYKSIGCKDNKCPVRSKEYKNMVERGVAEYHDVGTILTMDNPDCTLVQFRSEMQGDKLVFSPQIENIVVSRSYLALLDNIAKIVGADPEKVSPINQNKIMSSAKYLD